MTKRYDEMMATADDMYDEARRLEDAADELGMRAREMYPWHGPRKPRTPVDLAMAARLLEDYTPQLKAAIAREWNL